MTTHPKAPATTALITGSTRGIGAAIAAQLDARGVRVIRQGTKAADGVLGADLSDPAAPARLWAEALEMARERGGGRIDVLINNAGVFEANPIDGDDADWLAGWDRCQQINLTAAAQLSRLAVRQFQSEGKGGRIVQVASRAAYRGDSPDHWHYAAAKGGMVAMAKTIARHYARDGIYCFTICPGFVDTAMAGDYLETRGGPALLADIPLGRVAEPEEIGCIAAFCALDAPASMTGAVIDANGASFVR
ncbi:SDR family NAD(P)-dependent oxidoreductase [Croceicoccus naphthovorans]|uniref:3-oxoacyl-ACP reductase n=1 Tax=Croceicoccus naphthovorans TaxID=1348774 RepID=A0A0G3XIN4_9SPHN|nr:SDR family oxidoreductase [Croceicoccus naphthovorans]AKM10479.1 3-oxoacyl-ACP reductase [Croceicoccus naphthovorans]MBB3988653.1 NAD(P)-dependent dehydrogenase (short-subunit alcohol dehydrogenase family) [Croceicoccus naphthovorans]